MPATQHPAPCATRRRLPSMRRQECTRLTAARESDRCAADRATATDVQCGLSTRRTPTLRARASRTPGCPRAGRLLRNSQVARLRPGSISPSHPVQTMIDGSRRPHCHTRGTAPCRQTAQCRAHAQLSANQPGVQRRPAAAQYGWRLQLRVYAQARPAQAVRDHAMARARCTTARHADCVRPRTGRNRAASCQVLRP